MFTLECQWDRSNKLSSNVSEHILRVRINPDTKTTTAEGLPLRIAIALDTSSSMNGDKLAKAKEACIAIVNNLRLIDRLSLASYNTNVTTLLNNSNNKTEATQAINNLIATGVTRTDLALNWFREVLPPEKGVARVGILITDGNATDGKGMMLDDTSSIVLQGQEISQNGIVIDTVGLGDASNFNTAFLTDLCEKGKGTFIYADNLANFQSLLTTRLSSFQTVAIEVAKLKLNPKNQVKLKGFCCLRPDFLPLEEVAKNELLLGTIHTNCFTDILISVEVPPADFGDSNGQKEVLEIELITAENSQNVKEIISLNYTGSYKEIQQINEDIDQDLLRWKLKIYSRELTKTVDPNKTGELLINMQVNATKIGEKELAKTVASTLDNLQKTGQLTPHQTTSLLRDTRQIN